jgi:hypothetical protein
LEQIPSIDVPNNQSFSDDWSAENIGEKAMELMRHCDRIIKSGKIQSKLLHPDSDSAFMSGSSYSQLFKLKKKSGEINDCSISSQSDYSFEIAPTVKTIKVRDSEDDEIFDPPIDTFFMSIDSFFGNLPYDDSPCSFVSIPDPQLSNSRQRSKDGII